MATTLLSLLPFVWIGYLRPALELTKVVSATDRGAVLDVPESFSSSVDALVESAIAKNHRGGENVRAVLLRNRDRLFRDGMLLLAGVFLLLLVEFLTLRKMTKIFAESQPLQPLAHTSNVRASSQHNEVG